jgi:hypothetical protein
MPKIKTSLAIETAKQRKTPSSSSFTSQFSECKANIYNLPVGGITRPPTCKVNEWEVCACLKKHHCEDGECQLRSIYVECHAARCPLGADCRNQRIQRRQWAKTRVAATQDGRGFGLFTVEDMPAGTLIIEYCGEVIDQDEVNRRIAANNAKGVVDFYYFQVDQTMTIDAGVRGSRARFINHSCSPNCMTQRWEVGNETRVGIFSKRDIPAGSEVTIDYHFESFWKKGEECQCRCGSVNCSGVLGGTKKTQKQIKAAAAAAAAVTGGGSKKKK